MSDYEDLGIDINDIIKETSHKSKVDDIIKKAEDKFSDFTKKPDLEKERIEYKKSVQDKLKNLELLLKKSKNAKTTRPAVNQRMAEKRKNIKKEIEKIKTVLAVLGENNVSQDAINEVLNQQSSVKFEQYNDEDIRTDFLKL